MNTDISKLVSKWGLNKAALAKRCRMNPYTFKMKLLPSATNYVFSEDELSRLEQVLRDIAQEIIELTQQDTEY